MKLLYIDQYFCFPDSADGVRSYDLATSFIKEGVDVTILTSDQSGNSAKGWSYEERDGLKVYKLNCPYNNKMNFWQRIWAFCKFFVQASIKSLSIDFDIMLSSSTPLTNGVPALTVKYLKRKPYVFEVRDVWPGVPIAMGYFKNKIVQKLLYAFEYKVYKNASAIVPLSIGMDANIRRRFPTDKTVVIPNLSVMERFEDIRKTVNIEFPIDKTIVLYAGTFGNVNGLSYVLDVANETIKLDENLWFYLIGKGKEKDDIKARAITLGLLNKNVFIFDPVKKSDLPYVYSNCSIGSSYVIDIPALWDNSANKFFDTLAAGKPMLINHEGWQADVIRENNCGYILGPNVDTEMVRKFVEWANNKELLIQQGKNAYELAKREYSLGVASARYMNIFNSINYTTK